MPRNANLTGQLNTLVTAGVKMQPLFLDWDNADPTQRLPEFRAPSATYDLTIQLEGKADSLDLEQASGSFGTVTREAMNSIILMFLAEGSANDDIPFRVTRWYRVVLPITSADEITDMWVPVSQTFTCIFGNNANSSLDSAVKSAGVGTLIADTITRVVGVGSPDENLFSPTGELPGILILDCHGADYISIELTSTDASSAPDSVQVLYGFE